MAGGGIPGVGILDQVMVYRTQCGVLFCCHFAAYCAMIMAHCVNMMNSVLCHVQGGATYRNIVGILCGLSYSKSVELYNGKVHPAIK